MERTNFNTYLFKALDAYPYELEKTVEALNYALSYDPQNAQALLLMGRVYSEQLGDYEKAKDYFAEALAADMNNPSIYPHYIYTLLLNEDYDEALKLLDYAKKVRATDKAVLFMYEAYVYEAQGMYKEAVEALKTAQKHTYNGDFDGHLGREIKRIQKKIPKQTKGSTKESNTENPKGKGILRRLNLL